MGMKVEVQRTARFCVFIAPGTSSKVDWATVLPSTKNRPLEIPVPDNSRSKMASDGSVASAVSVGARKVLPKDVILVAVHGARVDLNQAALDKACPNPGHATSESDAGYKAYRIRFDGNHTAVPLSYRRRSGTRYGYNPNCLCANAVDSSVEGGESY